MTTHVRFVLLARVGIVRCARAEEMQNYELSRAS